MQFLFKTKKIPSSLLRQGCKICEIPQASEIQLPSFPAIVIGKDTGTCSSAIDLLWMAAIFYSFHKNFFMIELHSKIYLEINKPKFLEF